jgi:hypothetical protein
MSKILTDEEKFKRLIEYTTDFIGVVEALDERAKVIILVESPSGLSLMNGSTTLNTAETLGQMRLFTLRAEQQEIINYNKRVFVQEQIMERMRNEIASNALNKDYKAN